MKRATVHCAQLALLAVMASLAACHLYRLERKLDPANAEFLSQVSWIITRQERKVFLELPDAEKPAFIEEFWHRRDPDPDNEENEFRAEYEKRSEEAARLFRNESKPGWLTDRGRILILFGPPDDRLTNPAGTSPGGACYEEWYYGQFPVVFIDRHCNGEYRLETSDLTSLRAFNLMYMHELNKAQDASLSITRPQGRLFDFNVHLRVNARTSSQLTGIVSVQVPIAQLSFSEDGDRHRCTIDIRLAFNDSRKETVWESVSNQEMELKTEDLNNGKLPRYFSIRLPFAINNPDMAGRLTAKGSELLVILTNRVDGQTLQKRLELK
jgi:GWxTD domain-containing protein